MLNTCKSNDEALRGGLVAVSYTHLDVYKRQILEIGEGTSEVQRMLIARGLGLPS